MTDTNQPTNGSSYNHESLQESFEAFVSELKKASEAESETDLDNYLTEHIASRLLEAKQVHGTSVFTKLEIAVELYRSGIENRGFSMQGAMYYMNDDAICWLLDHIYTMEEMITHSRPLPRFEDKYSHFAKALECDRSQLQRWLNGDVYERIQQYRNELETLQEA